MKSYLEANTTYNIDILEFTINNRVEHILREIYLKKPDFIGFSCYIWNFECIKILSVELKKLLPNIVIVWGGPEVSYNSEDYIGNFADFIICGEGEIEFTNLIDNLENNIIPNNKIIKSNIVDMSEVPFVYDDIEDLNNKIIYYESSRGCPFNCQYCMSSIEKKVHYLPLDRTFFELQYFLDKRVRQVKFVDRTFNCSKERTLQLWKYLIENDNGYTNFHFEIAGELIDAECLEVLSRARNGYFQLEIGVQSTNIKTLSEIKRFNNIEKLFSKIDKLLKLKNIHIHLDLIAGLPYEDLITFEKSFNDVFALKSHQLQLGFLKVLKGSGVYYKKDEYNYQYTALPPYEILSTKWLSYDEILQLKMIEDVLEKYYNSGRYKNSVEYLSSFFESKFQFFLSLGKYYYQNNYHIEVVSEVESYSKLYEFSKSIIKCNLNIIKEYIKFDLFSHKKAKKLPSCIQENYYDIYKSKIHEFFKSEINQKIYCNNYSEFNSRQLENVMHIGVFDINPFNEDNKKTALLFDYRETDFLGYANIIDISNYII